MKELKAHKQGIINKLQKVMEIKTIEEERDGK